MADIVIERPHSLGREQTRESVERLAQQLNERLQIQYQWQGDEVRFSRPGADGVIHVQERLVRVELNLGLMLLPMKGVIRTEVEKYLDQYIQ